MIKNLSDLDSINIPKLIESNSILKNSNFKFGDHQGFSNGSFGTRSFQTHSFSTLVHEISHLIEFFIYNPDRINYHFFDFRLKTISFMNEEFVELDTISATTRESRTAAIQFHILNSTKGIELDLETYASEQAHLFRLLPDSYNFNPYKCQDSLSIKEKDKIRFNLRKSLITKYINEYNISFITDNWIKSLNLLNSLKS